MVIVDKIVLGLYIAIYLLVPSNVSMADENGFSYETKPEWTFSVGYNEAMDIPLELRTGLVLPKDWKERVMFLEPIKTYDLPIKFDWREMNNGLTPIKNQGSCGSCWAFSTAATFKDVIKVRDGITKDISEQYLVSCNTDGYSCGGGWYEHEMHKNFGLVPESEFPYEAQDLQCKQNLKHEEKLTSWAFVTQMEDLPSVEAIKNAIYTYGPISATVVADGSFSAYTGGVFNDCSGSGSVNHAINLVGWNDEEGYWIMKNSWGESWGEQGYMRIKYGCNQIGYAASFVVYKPSCNPQPEAKAGENKTIKAGEKVRIGSTPILDMIYSWEPKDGLDNPLAPQPYASPTQDTIYTLTVKTACGTAKNSIKVIVTKQ